ncbi:MAG: energy transducer TonB [Bacteroidia bacterium]
MKYILPFILFCSVSALAQDGQNYDYNKNIQVNADSDPVYPAGENAMYELVFNKIEFPREKINGESMINFDVNPDSTLSGFSIIKEVGYGIDQSIINILKQLKFSPGTINGKPVVKNMVLSFPIETE